MIFKYNKKIDKECWERIIKANNLFGQRFPKTYRITGEMEKEARSKVIKFKKEWDEKLFDFSGGMKKIFGAIFPNNITCYINTTPYSMDNYPFYISVSMKRKDPNASICHEASHFMLKKYFKDIKNVEEVKEIITVINYDVFKVKDPSWSIFKQQREKAFEVWKKTKNLKNVLKSITLEG